MILLSKDRVGIHVFTSFEEQLGDE